MRWLAALMGLLFGLSIAEPGEAQFTDVSSASRVDINAAKDGGATFGDLNHDGWLDLLVHTDGRSYLLINDGGSPPIFTDRTPALAPRLTMVRAERSAIIADLTNDGYNDIARDDYDTIEIYVNSGPPDFTFGDPAYLADDTTDPDINGEGIAVIDYDRDGWLDLFVEDNGPQIFDNPRDGTVEITRLDPTMLGLPDGRALGTNGDYVAAVDFDVDGWVDLAYRDVDLPTLFTNGGDGTFAAVESPVLSADRKGGIILCDFDQNGLFDLFFTGGAGEGRNRIFLQTTARTFVASTDPAPDGDVRSAACGDVDNDGDLDLYLAVDGDNPLYINQLVETGSFSFSEQDLGAGAGNNSECPLFADYDNDGDLDLYVNQTGDVYQDTSVTPSRTIRDPAPNVLLRNDTDGQSYLMVEVLTALEGTCPPALRSDIGAVAHLAGPMGYESGVRDVNGGQSHGSQGSPRMHFGLASVGPDNDYDLTVRFTDDAYPEVTLSVHPSELGPYQLLRVDATDIDGDGILTTTEIAQAGATPDLDGDGVPNWNDTDADGDGILDADEAGDADLCTDPVDADGSGTPDYLEASVAPGDAGVDGGDAAVGADAAVGNAFQAHGSGCLRCAAGGDGDDDARSLVFVAVLLTSLAARRRRAR